MTKRILSMLLVLAMAAVLCLSLASCDDEEERTASGDVSDVGGFLNEPKNFGGETITIVTHKDEGYVGPQIAPEELNDEPVNDAFYNRNLLIEEQYGIKIEVVQVDDVVETVRTNCASNLDDYQVAVTGVHHMAPLGVEGLLWDFRTVAGNNMHLDEAWWDQTVMEDLTLNGKTWFVTGDAFVVDDESTWAVYFNKDLVKSYGVEDPYQKVRDGKWTIDTMYEMAKLVHKQNGSTKSFDPEVGDVWGIVVQSYDMPAFMVGCGQVMVDTSGDTPQFQIGNEGSINAFLKVTDLMYDDKNCGVADFYGSWDSGVYAQEAQIFANGNALFMPGAISTVSGETMREAEINYGILPLPKLNEDQEKYTSFATVYHCSVASIPISNVEKLEATCYALEAMAYYGKEMVTPEFYERTLTLKRFKDEESADMLDIIFGNRSYDLGYIFNFGYGHGSSGSLYFYSGLLGSRSTDIVSGWEAVATSYQAGLDELIQQIQSK